MKILQKEGIVKFKKTREHTETERIVLESIRRVPFTATLHYAFQSSNRLHLVLNYACGGELFTHLRNHRKFREPHARFYIAEIVLALGELHKVSIK